MERVVTAVVLDLLTVDVASTGVVVPGDVVHTPEVPRSRRGVGAVLDVDAQAKLAPHLGYSLTRFGVDHDVVGRNVEREPEPVRVTGLREECLGRIEVIRHVPFVLPTFVRG